MFGPPCVYFLAPPLLDMFHILQVNMLDDFDKYMQVPDEWTPDEIKPYTPRPNLHKWLSDEKARDQLVIRAGTSTAVYWKDVVPELVYQKQIPYFYSLIAEK